MQLQPSQSWYIVAGMYVLCLSFVNVKVSANRKNGGEKRKKVPLR